MRTVKEPTSYLSLALIHVGHAFADADPDEQKREEAVEPDEMDKFPDEGEGVENLPPTQPDVNPLERENPDTSESDNESLEKEENDPESTLDEQDLKTTGETIVVDRRTGKDEF
ncbi:hypothetical protein [Sphingobacterium deserti]|nr:hypothetical protein [Sphingobacterium deserti]